MSARPTQGQKALPQPLPRSRFRPFTCYLVSPRHELTTASKCRTPSPNAALQDATTTTGVCTSHNHMPVQIFIAAQFLPPLLPSLVWCNTAN
ncbi:hypothetical protein FKM82_018967 [Ascaphus truei]